MTTHNERICNIEGLLLQIDRKWRRRGMQLADREDGEQYVRFQHNQGNHPLWAAQRWWLRWCEGQRIGERRLISFTDAGVYKPPRNDDDSAGDDNGTVLDRLEGNDDLRRWLKSPQPEPWEILHAHDQHERYGEVVCPRCGSDHTEAVINTDCEDVRGRCSLIFCHGCRATYVRPLKDDPLRASLVSSSGGTGRPFLCAWKCL